ncbi:hypothetical protein DES36_10178 [Alkalibaculum bacchi]|uniref:Uncharacterized protein n=1 Tax=Alkalibaculum bacchi TaxID=645887 RepID=A0A366IFU2_9FIRM|nr:hypothetical protein [Alkalibaculum bacchi]RBP70027.1 hypothetical protein DES36_10178 [Alkalibaculum bacchi]
MFKEQNHKTIIYAILGFILFVILLIANMAEFLTYFLITDSFTFLELPIKNASVIEFIIFAILSTLISLFSIALMRVRKYNANIAYALCLIFIIMNALKLIFYFPSITLNKEHFFFLLKQYIPLVTNTVTIFFGAMQISEIKYDKYK